MKLIFFFYCFSWSCAKTYFLLFSDNSCDILKMNKIIKELLLVVNRIFHLSFPLYFLYIILTTILIVILLTTTFFKNKEKTSKTYINKVVI